MLHQTFPLFLPKFNHFSSSSATTNPSSSSSPPTTTTSSSQVKPEEMECVEAKALKTSCWPEMGLKSVIQQEELILGGGGNGIPNCGDDSFVDDLLDFPKEEVDDDKFIVEEEDEEKDSVSVSSHEQNSNCGSDVSAKDEFGSVPGSELCVPADDLADLEWLSHFVEDSFTEFSFPYPSSVTPTEKTQTPIPNTNTNTNTKTNRSQLPVCSGIPFPSPVPAKARSKRSRTNGGRVWSLGSPSFSESTITTTTTTSSSSYSSPSSSSSNSCLIFTNSSSQNLNLFYYPTSSKKQKKKKSQTEATQNQRRCSHCGVQKTPQWRTGPLGAKTLCNACGVRFKSGRLLPEYRPACSPTFSSEVHSNNHRKVLEMRRKKDTGVPDSGTLSPAVHSF